MTDHSLVIRDEEIVPDDHSDGTGILKTVKKYLGISEKSSLTADTQNLDKYKDGTGTGDKFGAGDKVVDEITSPVSTGDEKCSNVVSEESRYTKSIKHYGGFDLSLNSQNEILFTETRRKDESNNEANGNETGQTKDGTQTISEAQTLNSEDHYKLDHARRGYMLLIANEHFIGDDNMREGVGEDLRKMEDIRTKFGFELLNADTNTNLTKSQIRQLLRRAQLTDHSDCDCFVFMISTHGEQLPCKSKTCGENYGLLCTDGQIMQISEIVTAFNDENCPTLKDKPKLFFIQACRGSKMDGGSEVRVLKAERSADGNPSSNTSDIVDAKGRPACFNTYMSSNRSTSATWDEYESPYLNCENDMLVMFAAPPGMYAWRNESKGSWMIDELHKVLMAYNFEKPKNLLNVLTKVSRMMSRRVTHVKDPALDGKVVVPVIESKLSKDILF